MVRKICFSLALVTLAGCAANEISDPFGQTTKASGRLSNDNASSPILSASLTYSPGLIEEAQDVLFTVAVEDGTAPYSYRWVHQQCGDIRGHKCGLWYSLNDGPTASDSYTLNFNDNVMSMRVGVQVVDAAGLTGDAAVLVQGPGVYNSLPEYTPNPLGDLCDPERYMDFPFSESNTDPTSGQLYNRNYIRNFCTNNKIYDPSTPLH
jgi:hypothetical protein